MPKLGQKLQKAVEKLDELKYIIHTIVYSDMKKHMELCVRYDFELDNDYGGVLQCDFSYEFTESGIIIKKHDCSLNMPYEWFDWPLKKLEKFLKETNENSRKNRLESERALSERLAENPKLLKENWQGSTNATGN